MIAAPLLALPAIALLAAGTPRQTAALLGAHVGQPARRRLRCVGWLLLALSGAMTMAGDDRARAFLGWAGAGSIAALAAALACTLFARRPPGA